MGLAIIDIFPQVNARTATEKIPLRGKHHTWTDSELLFLAGI